MIQFSGAAEGRINDKIVTVAAGWGIGNFSETPWYLNLIGAVSQIAPGIRRYGLVLIGFFVTIQFCDVAAVQKAVVRSNSSAYGQKLRAGSSLSTARKP